MNNITLPGVKQSFQSESKKGKRKGQRRGALLLLLLLLREEAADFVKKGNDFIVTQRRGKLFCSFIDFGLDIFDSFFFGSS